MSDLTLSTLLARPWGCTSSPLLSAALQPHNPSQRAMCMTNVQSQGSYQCDCVGVRGRPRASSRPLPHVHAIASLSLATSIVPHKEAAKKDGFFFVDSGLQRRTGLECQKKH
ncbi:hypothetical protein K432DRAFT_409709 [Lepidopterella palustris CBS 459.81]|uniref:Uncharacterized protein n=1 Tax=Lepidopterella palustris CBS 459.81 TaxID=1314670 RepID=A0A8E2J9U3_9PEZI|nr:hypothetical protein K432DRAFT_409709 [Lepidopterella palustris CBS 459.81]